MVRQKDGTYAETDTNKSDRRRLSLLYDLRNDEDVRKIRFRQRHFLMKAMWHGIRRNLVISRRKFMFLKLDGENIGQARVDLHGVDGEISYALCQKARGYGYAKWMLRCMEDRLREQAFCRKMTAEVKRENIASQKIFEGLSYSSVSTDYGYIYEKEIPLLPLLCVLIILHRQWMQQYHP